MSNRGNLAGRWLSALGKRPIIAMIVVIATILGAAAALIENVEKIAEWTSDLTKRPAIVAFTLSPNNTSYEEKYLHLLGPSNQTTRTFEPQIPVQSDSNAVFLVSISNPTKHDIIFTKVIFDIKEVGKINTPTPEDPLPPNGRYNYKIDHAAGQQLKGLVPPFRVRGESADSLDLEISSASKGHGLAWAMRIGFVTTDQETVYTEPFELVLLGSEEAK